MISIIRGGLKNDDSYHNFFKGKMMIAVIRGVGRGSESYDRNYHNHKWWKWWTTSKSAHHFYSAVNYFVKKKKKKKKIHKLFLLHGALCILVLLSNYDIWKEIDQAESIKNVAHLFTPHLNFLSFMYIPLYNICIHKALLIQMNNIGCNQKQWYESIGLSSVLR